MVHSFLLDSSSSHSIPESFSFGLVGTTCVTTLLSFTFSFKLDSSSQPILESFSLGFIVKTDCTAGTLHSFESGVLSVSSGPQSIVMPFGSGWIGKPESSSKSGLLLLDSSCSHCILKSFSFLSLILAGAFRGFSRLVVTEVRSAGTVFLVGHRSDPLLLIMDFPLETRVDFVTFWFAPEINISYL